mmetsp:Transcript_69610/g.110335  ORF Transcript_69610/g.110335 Transcript_69610/m.110335 type:complete len:205 (-) Transcript_69610:218-832(-)
MYTLFSHSMMSLIAFRITHRQHSCCRRRMDGHQDKREFKCEAARTQRPRRVHLIGSGLEADISRCLCTATSRTRRRTATHNLDGLKVIRQQPGPKCQITDFQTFRCHSLLASVRWEAHRLGRWDHHLLCQGQRELLMRQASTICSLSCTPTVGTPQVCSRAARNHHAMLCRCKRQIRKSSCSDSGPLVQDASESLHLIFPTSFL